MCAKTDFSTVELSFSCLIHEDAGVCELSFSCLIHEGAGVCLYACQNRLLTINVLQKVSSS